MFILAREYANRGRFGKRSDRSLPIACSWTVELKIRCNPLPSLWHVGFPISSGRIMLAVPPVLEGNTQRSQLSIKGQYRARYREASRGAIWRTPKFLPPLPRYSGDH